MSLMSVQWNIELEPGNRPGAVAALIGEVEQGVNRIQGMLQAVKLVAEYGGGEKLWSTF